MVVLYTINDGSIPSRPTKRGRLVQLVERQCYILYVGSSSLSSTTKIVIIIGERNSSANNMLRDLLLLWIINAEQKSVRPRLFHKEEIISQNLISATKMACQYSRQNDWLRTFRQGCNSSTGYQPKIKFAALAQLFRAGLL